MKVFRLLSSVLVISSLVHAAPIPTLTFSTDSSTPLLGAAVTVSASLQNTSVTASDTGFFPMYEITLPAEFECDAACAAAITVSSLAGASAEVTRFGGFGMGAASYSNPVTGESVAIAADETLLFIEPPLGTLSVGQPSIVVSIPATFTADAVVGTPLDINGRGIFALGDVANGAKSSCAVATDTICATAATYSITPTVLEITSTHTATVAETTGPNYPRTFNIDANVANGETVTNSTITYALPDEVIVVNPPLADCTGSADFNISPAPDSCTYTDDPNGGSSFSVTFNSITGTGANDIQIDLMGYVQEHVNNDGSTDVVDASTGVATSSTSNTTLVYDYGSTVNPPDIMVTIPQRSIQAVKSGSIQTDNAPAGNSPGDIIEWDNTTYVSDYFGFDDMTLTDRTQDGQTYVLNSSLVQFVLGGTTSTGNPARTTDAAFGADLVVNPKDGAGVTLITFDVSGLLVASSGALTADGTNPTSFLYSYRTTIDENFVAGGAGGNTLIVNGGDTIDNEYDFSSQVLGTANRQDLTNISDSITIAPIDTMTKSIAFVNGAGVGATPNVEAGDTVTYRITFTVPTGDAENLELKDYLPTPIFSAEDPDADSGPEAFSEAAQGDTAPAAAQWRHRTTSTVTPSATVTAGADDNSLTFDFADLVENGGASATETIDILFTVVATNEPYSDGLILNNLAILSFANSESELSVGSANSLADLTALAPLIDVSKTADNTSGDAGQAITYTVTLNNIGADDAFDVEFSDTIPTGIAPAGGGLNLMVTGAGCGTGALVDTSVGGVVSFIGVTLTSGSTCTVTYDAEVQSTIGLGQTHTNTATVLYASVASGTKFSPESDTEDFDANAPTLTAHTFQAATSSDAATTDPNLRPGETADFQYQVTFPEGVSYGTSVTIRDFATGNPEGNFLDDISSSDLTFPAAIEQNCANGMGALFNFVGDTTLCFSLDPTDPANVVQVDNFQSRLDLGDVYNTNNSDTDEVLTITYEAEVNNVAAGSYDSNARLVYTGGFDSEDAAFSVVTPELTLTKTTPTSLPVAIGETVRFVATVSNSGSSPAYDIASLVDTLPTGLSASTLVTATNATNDVTGQGSFSFNQLGQTLTVTILDNTNNPDLVDGQDFVLTYDTTVQGTFVADTTSGLGHPGGVVDGPGCVDDFSNSIDVASFTTGDAGSGDTITDVTAIQRMVTLDSDNDGVPNSVETIGETCPDSDGDGVADHLDTDSDDNGIPDATEYNGGENTDGDGLPNYRDLDDDGDGISDLNEIENGNGDPMADADGDGVFDRLDDDSDNDGIADSVETDADFDGDGIPNYLDLDSDNDGLQDVIEAGGIDADGDGVYDCMVAIDANGFCADVDPDDAGTPVPDTDFDGDGAPDRIDLDSDNDGVVDAIEAGGIDADGDGEYDCSVAVGTNGFCPDLDTDEGGTNLPDTDTDTDGVPNRHDLDSDNDGVADVIEAGGTDADGDGEYDCSVTLGTNGLCPDLDADEGGTQIPDVDADGDNISDRLELDSDNDGILDTIESDGVDLNMDGLYDCMVAVGADGFCPDVDTDDGGTQVPDTDTDGDGVPDRDDLDSDNDGVSDLIETAIDTDSDTVPDYRDLDSDNDAIPDSVESGGRDADGDGIYDCPTQLNLDNNGFCSEINIDDGGVAVPDTDTDNDGNPDRLEIDSNNDGTNDIDEVGGVDNNNDGIVDCMGSLLINGFCADYDPADGGTPIAFAVGAVHLPWNSFIDIVNIVEVTNISSGNITVTVIIYTATGDELNRVGLNLAPGAQQDVILDIIEGFVDDTYGSVRIEATGAFGGRLVQYRPGTTEFDFVFSEPVTNSRAGESYVHFNTFNPSLRAGDEDLLMRNWLTLINLEDTDKVFRVTRYNGDGTVSFDVFYNIVPRGRFDVDGGHGSPGPNFTGYIKVTPVDPAGRYHAHIARYGAKTPLGVTSEGYNFASFSPSESVTDEMQYLPVTATSDFFEYVEISNYSGSATTAEIAVYAADGTLLSGFTQTMPQDGTYHFSSSAILNGGIGLVEVKAEAANELLVSSARYRVESDFSVSGLDLSRGRNPLGAQLLGSYNLFLEQSNNLLLSNISSSTQSVTITGFLPTGGTEQTVVSLPAKSTSSIVVTDALTLPTDAYGVLSVRAGNAGTIVAEVIRTKPFSGTMTTEFILPTELQ